MQDGVKCKQAYTCDPRCTVDERALQHQRLGVIERGLPKHAPHGCNGGGQSEDFQPPRPHASDFPSHSHTPVEVHHNQAICDPAVVGERLSRLKRLAQTSNTCVCIIVVTMQPRHHWPRPPQCGVLWPSWQRMLWQRVVSCWRLSMNGAGRWRKVEAMRRRRMTRRRRPSPQEARSPRAWNNMTLGWYTLFPHRRYKMATALWLALRRREVSRHSQGRPPWPAVTPQRSRNNPLPCLKHTRRA